MWLSPLFTMRSPPKKISLTAAPRCEIAYTFDTSSLPGVLPEDPYVKVPNRPLLVSDPAPPNDVVSPDTVVAPHG